MTIQPSPITLDFTEIAEPIVLDDIRGWCDKFFELDIEVGRIVLWEHQLDYLLKKLRRQHGPDSVAEQLESGRRLWSVPLTIRKRLSAAAFIDDVNT